MAMWAWSTAIRLRSSPALSSRASGENKGTYAIGQGSLSAGDNYTIAFNGADFTISPASLAVTADALSKIYGAADPTLTYGDTGLVNGDTAAVFSGGLSRAAGEYNGTYAINQGRLSAGANYTIVFNGADFTINPASLTVTADALSKTYGAADPTLTYGDTGLVNGDTDAVFTGGLSRASGENKGTYAINQGSLSAGANYTIAYTSADFTINPASLTVTADALSKIYGDADPTLTYSDTGLVNGDTDAVFTGGLSRASGENKGTYAINQGSLSAGGNYTIAFTGASFAINPASLTVTADALKIYGAADPTLTYGDTGLVNGDTDAVFTGALSRTSAGENVTTYAINQGTLSAGANYTIAFTGADFTINPASLTVTADSGISKIYGTADPTLTYSQSGLVNGDTTSVFTGGLSRASGEQKGSYAISQGTLSAGANYTIAFSGADFTINPASLTVTADSDLSKIYGASDPTLTHGDTGLVNGDTASVFTGSLSRASGENKGTYAISQGTLSAGANYTIAFTGADFTINPASLTVTAEGAEQDLRRHSIPP